jgi:hypothetical protein
MRSTVFRRVTIGTADRNLGRVAPASIGAISEAAWGWNGRMSQPPRSYGENDLHYLSASIPQGGTVHQSSIPSDNNNGTGVSLPPGRDQNGHATGVKNHGQDAHSTPGVGREIAAFGNPEFSIQRRTGGNRTGRNKALQKSFFAATWASGPA